MAANGTFINDSEIEVGVPYELKDGDKIKIGSTILKFRTAI
jgi:pSer/pThr/pTyr-binding forkhead associated (FHA) protein